MSQNRGASKYVLMPSTNLWNADDPGTSIQFLRTARRRIATPVTAGKRFAGPRATSGAQLAPDIKVIDEVAPNESLLVSLTPDQVVDIARAQPGLRVVEVVPFRPLWLRRHDVQRLVLPKAVKARTPFVVTVLAADTCAPIAGLTVYGFTDRARQTGAENVTDVNGIARLLLPADVTAFEVIETDAPFGYWGAYRRRVQVSRGELELRCAPIDVAAADVRDHFGYRGADDDGRGVKVAVIDTGATKHADLVIAAGVNIVNNLKAADIRDEIGHGTHVCGIIAGRGKPGTAARGVAPGVDLHVYKVFRPGDDEAESFYIAKAIRRAVDDGCDLINLSLGAKRDVPDVLREVQRGRAMGAVCIAATGNDYRKSVGYPAAYSQVLAVSAMGRRRTYGRFTIQALCETDPRGTDDDNYFADFSNHGPQVALVAPGVGIVSTLQRGYAVMDGTSMACPVITGAMARRLSKNKKIMGMERNQKRSDAIIRMALSKAAPLGFGPEFEGAGLLV